LTAQRVRVAPSLLSADFASLERSVRLLEDAGCDLLHLDVMDAHFVPNLTFGPVVVQAVRRLTRLPLDVHLMIENPIRWVDDYANAGADWLTVHVEACEDVAATLATIAAKGPRPGLTLRPGTPFANVEPFLSSVKLVLVMTVEPGFGGQAYRPEQEAKLTRARDLRTAGGFSYVIEVDGGINAKSARRAVEAGAEILVTGSSLFSAPDIPAYVAELHALEALRTA
jgi:ribulose-phosphate 3-epimerase